MLYEVITPDHHQRTRRPAHALHPRPDGRAASRRGHDPAAAHTLPGNDHLEGRRPPSAQEADRGRGPVRRGVPQGGTAEARLRIRVQG